MDNEILGGQPAEEVNADTAIAHINESLKAVEQIQHPIGLDSHFGNDKPDFESLYHAEKLSHDFTKHELAGAKAMIQGAVKMGFKFGVGIHGGS